MKYSYVLLSEKDGEFTSAYGDFGERFQQHNKGRVRSTAHRRPLSLAYYEAVLARTTRPGVNVT